MLHCYQFKYDQMLIRNNISNNIWNAFACQNATDKIWNAKITYNVVYVSVFYCIEVA